MCTLIEQLSDLVTDICEMTKNGSLLLNIHQSMQLVNQEHRCLDSLRKQLMTLKKVTNTSSTLVATIQSESAQLEMQMDIVSQCRQNARSIFLDAEASVTVITHILTQARHERISSLKPI